MKSGPKVDQKWTKSGPKVDQKWIKSGLKVDRKCIKHSCAAPAIAPETKHPAGPYFSNYFLGIKYMLAFFTLI